VALNCDFASVQLLLPGPGAHPMGAVSMADGLAVRFAGAAAARPAVRVTGADSEERPVLGDYAVTD
jgi:hypothetical protein